MTYASKTPEQQQNFQILLNGMVEMYGDKRVDSHFKMGNFQWRPAIKRLSERYAPFTKHDCDTAACLLGHGPIFGIIDGRGVIDWDLYAIDFFGVEQYESGGDWDLLFSNDWSNDIQEAIARLRMYIDGFDPENDGWDYSDRYAA